MAVSVGVKMKKDLRLVQQPVQCIIPNSDDRGQGHLMPVRSPKQCKKRPLGAPPIATMAFLSSSLATSHRLPAQPPATCTRSDPAATRRRMRWSVGTEWWLRRGKCLAAVSVLSHPQACRSSGLAGTGKFSEVPWLAFPASSSCRGLVLPGKLFLPGLCLLKTLCS